MLWGCYGYKSLSKEEVLETYSNPQQRSSTIFSQTQTVIYMQEYWHVGHIFNSAAAGIYAFFRPAMTKLWESTWLQWNQKNTCLRFSSRALLIVSHWPFISSSRKCLPPTSSFISCCKISRQKNARTNFYKLNRQTLPQTENSMQFWKYEPVSVQYWKIVHMANLGFYTFSKPQL